MIKQLTIFGVGLIGGSLALALRKSGYCEKIIGCSRDAKHLQRAVDLGVIDSFTLDPKEAVKGSDMILLAVPLRAMKPVLESIVGHMEVEAFVTDAGSAKGSVIEAATEAYGGKLDPRFIAGHPIAGREKSSVEAAIDNLYLNQKVVLTPTEATCSEAVVAVKNMWKAAGATVDILDVKQNDDVLAATSHLPNVLAYSLVNTLSKSQYGDAIFDYAAGGFKSFTRIASSDPVMWRDICLENKEAILSALNDFQQDLSNLGELIEAEDEDAMTELFARAKATRDRNIS